MADTPNQERGMKLRREVLGDEHVGRSLARATVDPFLRPVQDMATEFGWGAVWVTRRIAHTYPRRGSQSRQPGGNSRGDSARRSLLRLAGRPGSHPHSQGSA